MELRPLKNQEIEILLLVRPKKPRLLTHKAEPITDRVFANDLLRYAVARIVFGPRLSRFRHAVDYGQKSSRLERGRKMFQHLSVLSPLVIRVHHQYRVQASSGQPGIVG